jgi:transcriptional regulator, TetR family
LQVFCKQESENMARTRATDFEEKRRGILDHAAAVFAEQGMEKASMSQIATHSGVSKALLYHYYPSKDALIYAIIVTHLEELDQAIQAADAADEAAEKRLRRLGRGGARELSWRRQPAQGAAQRNLRPFR